MSKISEQMNPSIYGGSNNGVDQDLKLNIDKTKNSSDKIIEKNNDGNSLIRPHKDDKYVKYGRFEFGKEFGVLRLNITKTKFNNDGAIIYFKFGKYDYKIELDYRIKKTVGNYGENPSRYVANKSIRINSNIRFLKSGYETYNFAYKNHFKEFIERLVNSTGYNNHLISE